MTQTPRSYDDQIQAHHYNSTAVEAENRSVSAAYPCVPFDTTPHTYASHEYCSNDFRPSAPLPALHHGGSNTSPFMHPSYSLMFAGSAPLNDCGILIFPQPYDAYNQSSLFYSPPNLSSSPVHGHPSFALHRSKLGPTPYSIQTWQQLPWPAGDTQVDEYIPTPSHHRPTATLQSSDPSPHLHVDHALEPHSGTFGASYPCLWTENGVSCNVMVLATRPHMNRHLHTYHGFGGSDTRQTKCYWADCGETMQQGSIARHMVTCHLQAKVTCPLCFKKLSRQDVISKHQRVCPAAGAWR